MHTRTALLGIVALAAAAHAGAAIEVTGVGIRKTINCAGGSVAITGTSNQLTLKGDCEKITISGTSHVVRAEGVGRVKVSGLNNLVEWQRALAGEAPGVEDSGMGNEVRRASGAAKTAPAAGSTRTKSGSGSVTVDDSGVKVETEAGEVSVTAGGVKAQSGSSKAEVTPGGVTAESGRNRATVSSSGIEAESDDKEGDGDTVINGFGVHRTIRCAGRGITINGANHVLRLEGDCRTVTVNGMGQQVKVEAAGSIVVNGTSQRVEWVRGLKTQRPSVQKNGLGNEILQITAEEFSKR